MLTKRPGVVRGALAAAVMAIAADPARADAPDALCKCAGTDDTTRRIPVELAPAVNAAFGTRMPARMVIDTTVFRCAGGRVLVCTSGANLPCGKANTSREAGAGVVRWCREKPDAAFVPAVASGHDTIYAWRCRAGVPEIAGQTLHVDPRGFIAEFWRALP